MHAVVHHPNTDASIVDLQSKHPCAPLSEKSKTGDSHCGKHGMFRIVRNLCPKSMLLLPEVLDGRDRLL